MGKHCIGKSKGRFIQANEKREFARDLLLERSEFVPCIPTTTEKGLQKTFDQHREQETTQT